MTLMLVRKILRDIRVPLLVMTLVLFAFELFWVKIVQRVTTEFAPLFQGIAKAFYVPTDTFQNLFFRGPGKLFQSIMGGEGTRFYDPQDMLAVGYLHPFVQTMICLWAVGRAAGAIAGEIDRGTMELLMAQPIPRWRIVLSHLWIDLIVLPILCLGLFFGSLVGTWAYGPFTVDPQTVNDVGFPIRIEATTFEIDAWALGPGMVNVFALLFAISGYTMWLSARGRFRNWVIAQAIFITLVQFVINVLGQLWDGISFLRPFTVFYYYQPQEITLRGTWFIELGTVWNGGEKLLALPCVGVLFVVGAIGYLMAFRTFNRRDLPAPL
jgi:ABC-2 type transport system permease protein